MGIGPNKWFRDRQTLLGNDDISYWIVPFLNRLRFAGITLNARWSKNTYPVETIVDEWIGWQWLNPKNIDPNKPNK
jgi:hypothetical protein